ncbi:hypothetical protein D5086_028775 [Populus alba]|uniref:Uncharacterized protein n=1 Tax=Populus alba TaxID=43335 RepID=A0ACC4ARN8_POPAL
MISRRDNCVVSSSAARGIVPPPVVLVLNGYQSFNANGLAPLHHEISQTCRLAVKPIILFFKGEELGLHLNLVALSGKNVKPTKINNLSRKLLDCVFWEVATTAQPKSSINNKSGSIEMFTFEI